MENEMKMLREFYQLSITIYKYSNLPRDSRSEDEKEFLNKTYSQYAKLCETFAVLKQKFKNGHLVNNNAPLTIEDCGSDDSHNSQMNLNALNKNTCATDVYISLFFKLQNETTLYQNHQVDFPKMIALNFYLVLQKNDTFFFIFFMFQMISNYSFLLFR